MGASESTFSSVQTPDDKITTVSERSEASDPILEILKSLKITPPILTSPPTEGTLTDILVRKPSSSSVPAYSSFLRGSAVPQQVQAESVFNGNDFPGTDVVCKVFDAEIHSGRKHKPATVNPKVLLELFSMYRDWQEEKAQKISKRQEDIENKIEVADALAIKIFQRFNYSVSTMKTTSQHLSEVHGLQVEIGEFKGRLTEVISNCDALCKRIAAEGPESLRSSIKPFAITASDQEICLSSSSSLQTVSRTQNSPSAKE